MAINCAAIPEDLLDIELFGREATGKIALAHLNEFPDYYTRLERMEEQAKREHGVG